MAQLHPSPQTIPAIWQIYLDIVDPVLKLFHIPTTQRWIIKASQNLSQLDVAIESVLFAVYYASAIALPATECQKRLGQTKDELLERYFPTIPILDMASLKFADTVLVLQLLCRKRIS